MESLSKLIPVLAQVSNPEMGSFKVNLLDIVIFCIFVIAVISVGLIKSGSGKGRENSEDYFLAGRGLAWWLIGISLIAANISTEQFIGMSGSAAGITGLAIASFEWMAAVTLIIVGFFVLPKFLKSGVYTIPQFLEYRYDRNARTVMSVVMIFTLVSVNISAVVYSGAIVANTLFRELDALNLTSYCWIIGVMAAIYVCAGGLKACAWADLLQGTALILGGAIIAYFTFSIFDSTAVSAITTTKVLDPETLKNLSDASLLEKFVTLNSDKLTMYLPKDHPEVPWTALIIGLWIPNLYYWGFNQYIIQRTLGSKSLSEGQKGIVFASALKLVIPFIIVLPGILSFNLYSNEQRIEAQRDFKILEQNAINYSCVYFDSVEKAGKAITKEDTQKYFTTVIDNQETLLISDLRFDEISKSYADKKASGGLNKVLLIADKGWLESNPKLAQLLSAWNSKVDEKSADLQKLKLTGYKYDSAFALLIRNVLPENMGLRGFVFAALLGAVVSSLASMLNAASTMFSVDIFKTFISPNASDKSMVFVGRVSVLVCAAIGCCVAPLLANPNLGTVFLFIQEFQGFISPGALAIFAFGMFSTRTPRFAGMLGLVTSIVVYGLLLKLCGDIAYLNRMAITVGVVSALLAILTFATPLKSDIVMPSNDKMCLKPSAGAKAASFVVLGIVAVFYITFSGLFF